MHIFLYGPPGTGKSTIGDSLARSLLMQLVDVDQLIESKAGISIAQIMQEQGEAAFRDMEAAALQEIVVQVSPAASTNGGGVAAPQDKVIALGGGALLRDENRRLVEAHGPVILLTAELDTLLERLKDDAGRRPLLAGDLHRKLTSLLEQRKEHYASFEMQFHVDGQTAEQVAFHIQTRLGRFHLRAMGEYDALVGSLEQLGSLLHERGLQNPIVVTDENLAKLHAESVMGSLRSAGFAPNLITVPAGEDYKNLETIQALWHGFLEQALDRKSTAVALGGGVIGDLTGFAAATYMRGIAWVCLPTTLLSMVDASLGGKTGFDLPEGKNLIGAFYPPKLVLADPQVLGTLPQRELISGLAEAVKSGIIADPELFELCACGPEQVMSNLEQVVKRSMAVKVRVIEEDPYERGFRAALNLGHTVGHAVELASRFELRHGEAIAIGMVVEAKLAQQLDVAAPGLSARIAEVLLGLGLPTQIPEALPRQEILRAMRVDKKKNAKAIRFALPAEIGRVELVDVTDLEMVLE